MIVDVSELPRRDSLTVVVLDVETTGLPRINNAHPKMIRAFDGCRLLSLAAMKWELVLTGDQKSSRLVDSMHHIVFPEDHVVPPCPVHDITHKKATRDGIPLARVIKSLCTMVDGADCVVAYNAPFDYNAIMSELHRYNYKTAMRQLEDVPWACAMRMATTHLGLVRWPKLGAAYAAMFPESELADDKLHDALYDTAVASQVFMRVLDPDLTPGHILTEGPSRVLTRAGIKAACSMVSIDAPIQRCAPSTTLAS